MTEEELDRWVTLVVAEARGQSLSPSARAQRRQIEREQPGLRGEASLWAEFAELEQPRPGERDDAAMIADVLARAKIGASSDPDVEPIAPAHGRRALGLASGLLLVAACVVLGFALDQLWPHGSEALDGGGAQALGGAAMAVDDQPRLRLATPGEHRLGPDDCRRAGESARLCTSGEVRFRVAPSSTERHVALELDEGQLHVDASAEPAAIEIRTVIGVVRTRGIVELRYDPRTGELTIDVIEGDAELIGSEPTPIHMGAGATLSLMAGTHYELEPPAPEPPAPEPEPALEPAKHAKPSAPEPRKPTADELLLAAQQALALGDGSLAIERYDDLIHAYPNSRAARTASVSLGRLLLRAGRGDEALAAFERYLESGANELVEEARYGRVRALRELGRSDDADDAIREFLTAHPASIHRERLEAWQQQ